MTKKLFTYFIFATFALFCTATENPAAQPKSTDTLEKMLVSNGVVSMNLDGAAAGKGDLHFTVAPDSFFTLLVFDGALRGPEPSSMVLAPDKAGTVPAFKNVELSIEKLGYEESADLAVRDAKSGFVFFRVEGHSYDYDAGQHLLKINNGRLVLSEAFAKKLGRAADANQTAGSISITATVVPIEVTKLVNGAVESVKMPHHTNQPDAGTHPGPDVIVGDLPAMEQAGSSGSFVGLGVATTSCNAGVVDLDWFQLSSNDHPVIPQNLYRMSGGASNNDRFEQIGQSWMKHAFTALTQNVCGYGCNGVGGTHLGSGCSDPYSASLNDDQTGIGSRAWANPFTGVYPGSNPSPNNHSGHTHSGTSHRVLVATSDLNTTLNVGATYFAEAQYVTPHEYTWCTTNSGCGTGAGNMAGPYNNYNNASYRRFSVTGTTSFSFTGAAATVREQPAIMAWTGATVTQFIPAPGADGIGFVGYKVTNPSAGVYHYEYAVYNENLDRGIQSFSVPVSCGTPTNFGFHMPPQPAAFTNDGTLGSTGYVSTAWTQTQTASAVTWNCETFAQNQNANAIRWGTMYNFRFDSNQPPQAAQATLGFFKTGSPAMVNIMAPAPCNPLSLNGVVSRKTHGAAGDFDVNLPLSGSPGIEDRSTGGEHTFVFTFSNNVGSGNASVTSGTGSVSGRTISGNTMSVQLTGVADHQQLTVTTNGVTDTFGQAFADTPVNAVFLMGDTSANSTVNASDVAQTKGSVGATVDGTNFRQDVNANGLINATDVGAVKSNIGTSYP